MDKYFEYINYCITNNIFPIKLNVGNNHNRKLIYDYMKDFNEYITVSYAASITKELLCCGNYQAPTASKKNCNICGENLYSSKDIRYINFMFTGIVLIYKISDHPQIETQLFKYYTSQQFLVKEDELK